MTAAHPGEPPTLPRPACTPAAVRAVLAANADANTLAQYDADLDAAYEQARTNGDLTLLTQTVRRWWFDADGEFADLPHLARQAPADLMDAVVIVDPAQYRRSPDEPDHAMRTLPFGPHSQGLVTFLIYPPRDLVLVVKIQWLGG